MATVVPAIIPKSFQHLSDEVAKVKDFVTSIQVDITDGIFVRGKNWPYIGDSGEFAQLLTEDIGLPFWEEVDYEFHLMVENPDSVVQQWIDAGASSIVVQVESVADLGAISALCRAKEVLLGVSLKPRTDSSVLASHTGLFDFIQCMGSNDLGHHGAELDPSVCEKIKDLRELYPYMPIAVDIGVTEETAPDLVDAGATKLVSGSTIFNSYHISETISFLQSL